MKLKNLNEKQLQKLALDLAQTYRDCVAIVGLSGPLGAGKTTFVKSFVKALGIKKSKSPSFTITHEYSGQRKIYHLDFYRLHDESQLGPLGLDEILNGENIVLIEWVDRFSKIQKMCNVIINLKPTATGGRDVSITTRKI